MRSIASEDPSKHKARSCKLQSNLEALPFMAAKDYYHIGGSQHSQYDILAWVYENRDNPGMNVRIYYIHEVYLTSNNNQEFILRLKDHLLACCNTVVFHTMETTMCSQTRYKKLSHSLAIISTSTKSFASTTWHITCAMCRTQSTPAPTHILWPWDTKTRKKLQSGTHIGMPRSEPMSHKLS